MLNQLSTKKRGGFTLVEIMIVVAIIALLAAIAVPSFLRARERSQASTVLNNLRLIEAAKDQWALETNQGATDVATGDDVAPYLKDGSPLADAALGAGATFNDPRFAGIVYTPGPVNESTGAALNDTFDINVVDADYWIDAGFANVTP